MYLRLFISLTQSVLWLLEKSDSWDSTQKHQTVYMNTEPPSYHKEIWVKSIAAQVRPGQRHNPVPRGVKSIRESLFSYYITIVLTFFWGELQSSDEWRKNRVCEWKTTFMLSILLAVEAGGSTPKEKIWLSVLIIEESVLQSSVSSRARLYYTDTPIWRMLN